MYMLTNVWRKPARPLPAGSFQLTEQCGRGNAESGGLEWGTDLGVQQKDGCIRVEKSPWTSVVQECSMPAKTAANSIPRASQCRSREWERRLCGTGFRAPCFKQRGALARTPLAEPVTSPTNQCHSPRYCSSSHCFCPQYRRWAHPSKGSHTRGASTSRRFGGGGGGLDGGLGAVGARVTPCCPSKHRQRSSCSGGGCHAKVQRSVRQPACQWHSQSI